MVNFLQKNTFFALKISLKGSIQIHSIIPINWTFSDLLDYLPDLLNMSSEVLIFRNHQLMGYENPLLLENCLKKTYDCHFPEDKIVLKLKIEKVVEVPQDTLLPLQLHESF